MFVAYQAQLSSGGSSSFRASGSAMATRFGSATIAIRSWLESISPGEMVVQGRPPIFLTGLPGFVTALGGGYFLLPGVAGLRALATGTC